MCPSMRSAERKSIPFEARIFEPFLPLLLTKQGRMGENATEGPVAQLGERLHGMQEVTGSIPVRSTNARVAELVYAYV